MVQPVNKKFAPGKDPGEGKEYNRVIKKEEHVEAQHSTSTLAPTAIGAVEVAPAVDPNAPVKRGRGRPRGSKSKKRERTEGEEEVLQGPDFKENGSHSNMLLLADVISSVRQRKAPKWINFGEVSARERRALEMGRWTLYICLAMYTCVLCCAALSFSKLL